MSQGKRTKYHENSQEHNTQYCTMQVPTNNNMRRLYTTPPVTLKMVNFFCSSLYLAARFCLPVHPCHLPATRPSARSSACPATPASMPASLLAQLRYGYAVIIDGGCACLVDLASYAYFVVFFQKFSWYVLLTSKDMIQYVVLSPQIKNK